MHTGAFGSHILILQAAQNMEVQLWLRLKTASLNKQALRGSGLSAQASRLGAGTPWNACSSAGSLPAAQALPSVCQIPGSYSALWSQYDDDNDGS